MLNKIKRVISKQQVVKNIINKSIKHISKRETQYNKLDYKNFLKIYKWKNIL